jgi:glycosyltransferase involved in cell wall biosynthesis
LSRLDEGKGLSESIKSFAVLKRARPTATLKIAGEGPERKLAERLAKELKLADVEFLGHVEGDDKRQILLASDIFLFPTFLTEGMPTVVLEAMAYGLPVVTRPVAGLQDFFENERMGFMTESRNPDDFGQLLTNLAGDRDLRRRIGDYNRAYAQRHFSASAVAGNLTDIYEKITA